MRLLNLLILLVIIAIMFTGQSLYNSDELLDKDRNIYNFTEEKLIWNESIKDTISNSFEGSLKDMNDKHSLNIKRIGNILGEFINLIGYSAIELTKWSLEYGYNHPEQDLKFFMDFLIKILWIIVIIMFIPLIIPVLALICIFFKGVIWLWKKIFNNERKKE